MDKKRTSTDSSNILSRQGHRLIQIGVGFFLFTSLWGFALEYVASAHLGLSVHTLAAMEGVILVALGLVWRRLNLGAKASRTAFWMFVYSSFATVIAYIMAALWGAGNSTMKLAAGTAHGSAFQETTIKIVCYSAAPTVLIALVLILWGLRVGKTQALGEGNLDECPADQGDL
jgi:hydroxylaminobenzene mutase